MLLFHSWCACIVQKSSQVLHQGQRVYIHGSPVVEVEGINFCYSTNLKLKLLGTTNMLEWVHTTYKHQNDLLCTCMHRNQNC